MPKLNELRGNPGNPRTITEDELKTLEHTLLKYGDLSGLVFNVETENLVGGHQRKRSLPGDSEIIITHRYATPTAEGTVAEGYIETPRKARYAYREVKWPLEKEMAANIAANKAGGDWDYSKLASWAGELIGQGWEAMDLGFLEGEMEDLLAPPSDQQEKEKCPQCGKPLSAKS